jgi:hypothetical protein
MVKKMSESLRHLEGVVALERFVRARAEQRADLIVYLDAPASDAQKKPPLVGGFRPDLFARTWKDGAFVIGEAKTAHDLESAHSVAQLGAFVGAVTAAPLGAFVLSVPLAVAASARALLEALAGDSPGLAGRLHCISPELDDVFVFGVR